MSIEIVNLGPVMAAFDRMIARGHDKTRLLDAIGNTVKEQTRLRFVTGTAPDGAKWKPVLRGGQPLRDTGVHLMNALSHRVQGDSVLVGVPYAWAATHQYGATIHAKVAKYLRFKIGKQWASKKQVTIPARPIFGIGPADRDELADVVKDVLLP